MSARPGSDRDTAAQGAGGRPDQRFPRASTEPAPLADADTRKEVLVSVVATVNMTRREGKIRYVNPIPGGQPSVIDPHSSVVLVGKGPAGEVLHEHPVRVNIYTDRPPEADREGLVDAIVPVNRAARAIELVMDGKVVDAIRIGGSPPVVGGLQRVSADGAEADLLLALDRPPVDDAHTFAVQVSTDRGRTWHTVAVGLREPTFGIDRAQFAKGQELQVRVIATNGLVSAVVTSEPFRV